MTREEETRELTARQILDQAWFAIRLAWRADRASVIYVIITQVLASAGIAGVVLLLRGSLGALASMFSGGAGASNSTVLFALAGLVVVGTAGGIMRILSTARQRILVLRADRLVVELVLDAAARVELIDFENAAFHDRLQRAVFASRSQPSMVITMLVTIMQALLTLLTVTATFVVMAWWLVPLALLSGLPVLRAAGRERNAGYGLHRDLSESRRVREYLERLLTGRDEAKEIRSLGLGGPLSARWHSEYEMEIEATTDLYRRHTKNKVVARLAADALIGLVIVVVWWTVRTGALDLATALAALTGLWLLSTRTQMVGAMLSNLAGAIIYLRDLREFAREDQPDPTVRPLRDAGGTGFETLIADQISFTYPGAAVPALSGVSMQLRAGEIVALVGTNGSGKTTLAKILAGLYRPDLGQVMRDDTAVTDLTSLRADSAVVFQDFVRYKLPALDNITFGRPETPADLEQVRRAASAAGVADFMAKLPEGYATMLSKEFGRGVDLSLGQWQRLALARAFYRNSPFVILDEPTASLDPQAEADLFARIRELFAGRTVLLISHRFSSVRNTDRIYVLDQGRVIEQGTHETLMDENGSYARLFRVQAAGYQLDGAKVNPVVHV
ncbi:ABC transporter ATP-binding protein [Micromonospora sp. NPDC047134]|uniref:ABC transporter ATP-binding protein n=1 Tax=Micromonospora sp. NPDC047134 TaxID=3154340 RepID=UPI0033CBC0CC